MLFRKKMPRSCTYCQFGTVLDSGEILCSKKGVRDGDTPCRRFRYDPAKRIPKKAKAMDFSKYDAEDFSL